jgi:hypothetical protein
MAWPAHEREDIKLFLTSILNPMYTDTSR